MTAAAAKKTAAKPTTTKTAPEATETEEVTKVSPIKRSTRTVLEIDLDGTMYTGEIDMEGNEEALKELDEVAKQWDAAQKAYAEVNVKFMEKLEEIGLRPERPKTTTGGPSQSKLIRRWARRIELEVNEQGKIPAYIVEKYEAAKKRGELNENEK
ncbi:histone-like nucleoid-structuring protein Lsr2 [Streptomyces sp. NPDC056210]|uniref:Lsr2 family DNA-binding protein n=1 Tax=Streptomyces sp. NPDC056210 TaxID=3345746 RepID=UPI0035DB0396